MIQRDELAERRVAVRVRAAGDRNHRRELGVAESGEQAAESGEDEREHDRGPGVLRRGGAVRTKMPAPMIAPMPSIVRFSAPSARLSVTSCPSAAASACRTVMLFLDHKPIAGVSRGRDVE